MSGKVPSKEPLEVAIVGSGPSGFYAAEALLRSEFEVSVTMIERLPTPYGLVRSGVAPDHQTLKKVMIVYDRIARSNDFHYVGNLSVGSDVTIDRLSSYYHAVILACGAQRDRRMDIPGESLAGSHTATEFVGWYNGHPDYRDLEFDLSSRVAVIVGQGNVAADLSRVLTKPLEELKSSDIAAHALEALAESKIEEVHVVGRRGPAQAKFTPKELRELGEISGCTVHADAEHCELNMQSKIEVEEPTNTGAAKNLDLFRTFSRLEPDGAPRKIRFRFCLSPKAILGDGRVEKIVLSRNRLEGPAFSQVAHPVGEIEEIPCGLVFSSISYRGVPIPGVPFDESRGVVPNESGRVLDKDGPARGLYVTGWIKRGANGIIGTNRADSLETVEALLTDRLELSQVPKLGFDGLMSQIARRGLRPVSFAEWLKIDATETERGHAKGKPREKFTRINDMLALIS